MPADVEQDDAVAWLEACYVNGISRALKSATGPGSVLPFFSDVASYGGFGGVLLVSARRDKIETWASAVQTALPGSRLCRCDDALAPKEQCEQLTLELASGLKPGDFVLVPHDLLLNKGTSKILRKGLKKTKAWYSVFDDAREIMSDKHAGRVIDAVLTGAFLGDFDPCTLSLDEIRSLCIRQWAREFLGLGEVLDEQLTVVTQWLGKGVSLDEYFSALRDEVGKLLLREADVEAAGCWEERAAWKRKFIPIPVGSQRVIIDFPKRPDLEGKVASIKAFGPYGNRYEVSVNGETLFVPTYAFEP